MAGCCFGITCLIRGHAFFAVMMSMMSRLSISPVFLVLSPPDAIPTPDAHDDHPEKGSDSSSRKNDDAHPEKGIDKSRLRTDEPGKGLSKFDRPLGADSDTPLRLMML